MARFYEYIAKKSGLPPGTLVHIGKKMAGETRITVSAYGKDTVEEREARDIAEVLPIKDESFVTWINIDGLHDTALMETLGNHFGFHPLFLEDILNTGTRPKIEDFESYMFLILKMLAETGNGARIESEQVSMIFGENYVITFQERTSDVFDRIRLSIRDAKARVRKERADYLAYLLVDAIVDDHFNALESMGERIEDIEEVLLTRPGEDTIRSIHRIKNEMLFLRKSVFPMREVVNYLERGESELIHPGTRIHFKDVYDHTVQIMDTFDTYRDIVSNMLDIYLSSLSNRMNQIMMLLTVFASIFIPLTFLAGVYGMNFDYLPGRDWRWSFHAFWAFSFLIGASLLFIFRKKKWL